MPDPTDVVGVLRVHLEEIDAALETLCGVVIALDLADSYRQGKVTRRPSRAAQMSEKAKETCEMYLRVNEEETDESPL